MLKKVVLYTLLWFVVCISLSLLVYRPAHAQVVFGPPDVVCVPPLLWNSNLRQCVPSSCPEPSVPSPLNGGGVACVNPPDVVCVPPLLWNGTQCVPQQPPSGNCIDGNAHVVPCSEVIGQDGTSCEMSIQWVKGNSGGVRIVAITPACADEAGLASSSATTRILLLRLKD